MSDLVDVDGVLYPITDSYYKSADGNLYRITHSYVVEEVQDFKFLVNGDGGVNKAYFTVTTEPSFAISWGDGTTSVYDSSGSGANLHTYEVSGEYVITISNYQKGFIKPNNTWLEVLTPFPTMDGMPTSFEGYFSSSNLRKCCGKVFINNPYITSFTALFMYAKNISEFPQDLFDGCVNAESFMVAFNNSSIVHVPSKFFSYCPKATNFLNCFSSCGSLVSIGENTFEGCFNAINFEGLFQSSSIESIKGNPFKDCVSATNFKHCFYNCRKLTIIEEDIFKGCLSAQTFQSCFDYCDSLISISSTLFSDCVFVTNFAYVFNSCGSLIAIPLTLFSGCVFVTNFTCAFASCERVTGEAPELWLRTNPTPEGAACFTHCTGLSNYNDIPSNWK